jgi:hypothetical protein
MLTKKEDVCDCRQSGTQDNIYLAHNLLFRYISLFWFIRPKGNPKSNEIPNNGGLSAGPLKWNSLVYKSILFRCAFSSNTSGSAG